MISKKEYWGNGKDMPGQRFSGRDTMSNGKKLPEPAVYEFLTNGTALVLILQPPDRIPYSIKGDVLTLGSMKFIIEKLTNTELVMLDYKNGDRKHPLAFRHFFRKSGR